MNEGPHYLVTIQVEAQCPDVGRQVNSMKPSCDLLVPSEITATYCSAQATPSQGWGQGMNHVAVDGVGRATETSTGSPAHCTLSKGKVSATLPAGLRCIIYCGYPRCPVPLPAPHTACSVCAEDTMIRGTRALSPLAVLQQR